ncbi:hypothetical protein RND71_010068 [Anisodus tanguticus]|uniref:Protein saal1 n=1 Tax=Anisodus tanguticus TaxID=243964 RepID=A0AAE1SJM9_9SOLA|nr:hypothetical protein RND71_010068 [Anisodus tanguticus]
MSVPPESPSDHNEAAPEEEFQSNTHHPAAPSDELFDITTTVDPSYIISLIRKLLPANVKHGEICGITTSSLPENGGNPSRSIDESETMKNVESSVEQSVDDKFDCQNKHEDVASGEEAWEEFGCILWDLAASRTHVEFMKYSRKNPNQESRVPEMKTVQHEQMSYQVELCKQLMKLMTVALMLGPMFRGMIKFYEQVENFVLEVLLATLMVSKSARITEICLGIIGNLACHDVSRRKITSTNGLIGVVLQQLFLDDTPCLCEACRLITLFLPSDESVFLVEALQSEHILCRILWIVENTLNIQLLEKSISLLLAIAESKQDVVAILLPPLIKLGLPGILVDLLSVEISKLIEERSPERYSILDLILQTVEALSVIDDYSQEICSNKEFFQLLVQLIKHPDKAEFANCCVTSSVLTANILTDATDLALEISQDMLFLQCLLDLFPYASDDIEARSAIWSILARLLVQIQKTDMSPSNLHQQVSVLTSKSEAVEDELLNYNFDDSSEVHRSSSKLKARTCALNGIVEILSRWRALEDHMKGTLSMEECYVNERDVDKMLHYCCKYTKGNTEKRVQDIRLKGSVENVRLTDVVEVVQCTNVGLLEYP